MQCVNSENGLSGGSGLRQKSLQNEFRHMLLQMEVGTASKKTTVEANAGNQHNIIEEKLFFFTVF